tara:strand:+ start:939 stop:1520 length:582 start_codon:yes stop_codon:yes gene_type:complete
MCFSFEVSIATFIISWSISLYLLSKGLSKDGKNNVIFLMIFSSMQLSDAILWYNKMKRNNINYIVTSYLIPFILSLQILYKVFVTNHKAYMEVIDDKLLKILIVYLICYIFYRFNGYSKSLCDNKLSSPVWGPSELGIWELLIFTFIIWYPNYHLFFATLVLFALIKMIIGGAYGTMWCTIANLLAFYYLYKY